MRAKRNPRFKKVPFKEVERGYLIYRSAKTAQPDKAFRLAYDEYIDWNYSASASTLPSARRWAKGLEARGYKTRILRVTRTETYEPV